MNGAFHNVVAVLRHRSSLHTSRISQSKLFVLYESAAGYALFEVGQLLLRLNSFFLLRESKGFRLLVNPAGALAQRSSIKAFETNNIIFLS